MPPPILATKLYIPAPRSTMVARPRLVEKLDGGLRDSRKLTLVSAAAGFGKTTLVSAWLAGCGRKTAWLSLDEGDADPARFLTYLVAALQAVFPAFGALTMKTLQASQGAQSPGDAVLTCLVNEIAAQPGDVILALDDYHLVDSRAVDEALIFLLDHLPPNLHLVVATREDPRLPLARLRAGGQLTELRVADLRFTVAEAAGFLNQVMGLAVSEEDVAALDRRTEGWIAGLQLAAISLQGRADPAVFIQSFSGSHHFVLDYLVEEVLKRQPPPVQDFLLRTSILERMCGPLCAAVTGETDFAGQDKLEAIERANLFIIPLDNERKWYRYHHLFGNMLRQRMRMSKEIGELHLRASHWFEENGELGIAFHHALEAGDIFRAADLAESAWEGMDGSFQTAAWLGWVRKLPENEIRRRPVLSTFMGMAFMDAGDPDASESHLRDAEKHLKDLPDGAIVMEDARLRPLPAMIAMARAYNAQVQGDLSATARYAELALQLTPEDDFFRRAQATITLEVTHWARGDLESARSALGNWMESTEKAGNIVFVVASAFALADILIAQGNLSEAEKTYRQALLLAEKQGDDARHITAHHFLGLAMLFHERGEDNASEEYLQKARAMGEQTTLVDWSYRWHISQSRLLESAGDLEGALIQLDEAGRAYVKNPIPDTRPIAAWKAKIHLKQGQLTKAQDWAFARKLSVGDETSYLTEFEHLILIRLLAAENPPFRGDFPQVDDLLKRLLNSAETQGRIGSILEILIVQAIVYQVQGNLSLAVEIIERALTLAEPEGYVRLFVDEGQEVRSLILDLQRELVKRQDGLSRSLLFYGKNLLSAFERAGGQKSTLDISINGLNEPLSERELEVLRLVAQGLSNGEICERLFLAMSTVKGHNQRIFDKLQVQRRTEAVARAHELGLL